jgi:hypothetical protein
LAQRLDVGRRHVADNVEGQLFSAFLVKALIFRLLQGDTPGMSDAREKMAALELDNAHLSAENARQQAEIARLKAIIEELLRGQKRQAAPFAKPPKPDPKPPGRKAGDEYGTSAFRQAPSEVDETCDAPLPSC